MIPDKWRFLLFAVIGASAAGCFPLPPQTPPMAAIAPRAETGGRITLIYPQVEGLGRQGDKINQTIEEEAAGFSGRHQAPDHSGQMGYKVVFNRNHLLSVRLRESFYVRHAAHPMSYQRAFTFDTRTGDLLRLEDLFRPDVQYRPKLDELAKAQLAQRGILLLKPFPGISDRQEFYLTEEALVIYYQLYEYTAYVYGFLEITIPYDQLAGLFRPEVIK
ncbi:MAG: DUF3298 domain-containing protein [Negativicutes bacterium]|nr:DUF3298 domain-containing protein [Negativicutes bacterium]